MATEPALRVAVGSRVGPFPFCCLEAPEFERLHEACDSKAAPDGRAYALRPGPAATLDPGGEHLPSGADSVGLSHGPGARHDPALPACGVRRP